MLKPNWFLTHVPAAGSQRPYMPLWADLAEQEARDPRPVTGPLQGWANAQSDVARATAKLERLAR